MLTNSLKEDTDKQTTKAKDFYGIWGDDGMSTDEFIDLIKSERVFHREIAEL